MAESWSRSGDFLRKLRIDARLTQGEVATAGISPRTISDLERGINQSVRGHGLAADRCAGPARRGQDPSSRRSRGATLVVTGSALPCLSRQ